MSENPDYPDAPSTAPGGMNQRALAEELIHRHGWGEHQINDWRTHNGKGWKPGSWPEMIEAVVEERRAREQEQQVTVLTDVEVEVEFCDPEEFFAEVEQAQAEGTSVLNNTALFIGMPDSRDYIFDGHAGAGPSGAERWMNCTESLGMARRFLETLTPNQQVEFAKGGDPAMQGTTAHAAGEVELRLVLGEIDIAERDATLLELAVDPPDGQEYDADMAEHVATYVDMVTAYINDRGGDHVLVEQRVSAVVALTGEKPNGDDYHVITGSGDAIVMPTKAEPDLVVIDYKHGEGIDVEVNENYQTRIYGLGALALLTDEEGNLTTDVDTLTYHIVQPRLGGIKTFTETLEDLLDWRDEVLSPALTAALTGDGATFNPSDSTCQWCPARGACPALAEQRVSAAKDLFDTLTEAEFADGPGSFPETDSLDSTRLGNLLSQIMGLIEIRDALKEEAQRRLHRGEVVPGFKLVGYTPPRKWTENAAEELDIYDGAVDTSVLTPEQVEALWQRKMLTPKQAITVLGKVHGVDSPEKVLADLIDSPVQRPVIAREDDRRHEWKGAPPEMMFEDESGTTIGDE